MLDESIAKEPRQNGARLYLDPQDEFNELGLEFAWGSYGVRSYLNVYSIPLKNSSQASNAVPVAVKTKICEYQADAALFQGGQRILLPDALTKVIGRELLEGSEVKIQAGRYQATIKPGDFKKYYKTI